MKSLYKWSSSYACSKLRFPAAASILLLCQLASCRKAPAPRLAAPAGENEMRLFNALLSDESRPAPKWLKQDEWLTRCFLGCSEKEKQMLGALPVLLEPTAQGDPTFSGDKPPVSTDFSRALTTAVLKHPAGSWPSTGDLDNSDLLGADMSAVKQIYARLDHCDHNVVLNSKQQESYCSVRVLPFQYQYHMGTDTSSVLSEILVRRDPGVECADTNILPPNPPKRTQFIYPLNCFHWLASYFDKPGHRTHVTDSQVLNHQTPDLNHKWDVNVMLGFHAMIADRPGWTWATSWWSMVPPRKPKYGPAARVPWNRYDLVTTMLDGRNEVHPFANPYLEAATEDFRTNCIFCHGRARMHPVNFNGGREEMPSSKHSELLPCYQGKEIPAVPANAPATDCSHSVPTHFLWSVANHTFPAVASKH